MWRSLMVTATVCWLEDEDSSVNVSPAVTSLHPLGRGRVGGHPEFTLLLAAWVQEQVWWARRGRCPGPALRVPSAFPTLAVHS